MSFLAIPLILLVWLMPLVLTSIITALYEPATAFKKGVGKMINRGVLVFYKYRHRTTMLHKDVCPLCHRSDMRCRVTINPLTGVHSHISLNAMRAIKSRGRRYVRSSSPFSMSGTRRRSVCPSRP